MLTHSTMTSDSTESQIDEFVGKFEPGMQATIRSVRAWLRERFPTAFELVYDNYNFFVSGYSSTPRPSDSVVSMAANAAGVGLCFIHGAKLSDPDGRLLGTGKQTRFIRVPSVETLVEPAVLSLIDSAERLATIPFKAKGSGEVIIRSVARRQRPRRKS